MGHPAVTGTGPYEAVVFDLDGVICFTDVYHYRGWKSIADELGIPFDETINNRLRGVSRMESLEIVLERYEGEPLSDARKEELAATKNERYRVMLGDMSPADLDPSVRTTLDELRGRGLKLAIGSSSKNATFILERIGLGDYFDAISDGTNITRSKPDPEVFLKAAEFLGVSRSWVYQATASGRMPCIRVGALLRFNPAVIKAWARGEAATTKAVRLPSCR